MILLGLQNTLAAVFELLESSVAPALSFIYTEYALKHISTFSLYQNINFYVISEGRFLNVSIISRKFITDALIFASIN